MIQDWNREDLQGLIFTFRNSDTPYTTFHNTEKNFMFLNLYNYLAYDFDELDIVGLKFYEDEEDEDFHGVKVIGRLNVE